MVSTDFPVDIARTFMAPKEDMPKIGFLGGEQGKEINEAIKKDYKGFGNLGQGYYREKDKIVWNVSNPFYTVAVQDRLPQGVRVATQSDLEKALKLDSLNLSDICATTSLVLRSEEEPNSYLARDLMNQIKTRENRKLELPVMIPLCGLSLKKDDESSYGLSFKLKEDAEIIPAPILDIISQDWINHYEKEIRVSNYMRLFHSPNFFRFYSKDINPETGLPNKVYDRDDPSSWPKKKQRSLDNSRTSRGLSFLVTNECDINSGLYELNYSPGVGRVIIVSPGNEK